MRFLSSLRFTLPILRFTAQHLSFMSNLANGGVPLGLDLICEPCHNRKYNLELEDNPERSRKEVLKLWQPSTRPEEVL